MPFTLDHEAYPHILDAVVSCADRAMLLTLRRVSSGVRALAERRLFRYVAVALDSSHDPPVVVLVEPRSPHRRLPFLVPKLHHRLCGKEGVTWDTWEATLRALRIVEVHVSPSNEALRHLISLIPIHRASASSPPRSPSSPSPQPGVEGSGAGVRLMLRAERGGRVAAEDVLTKIQAPSVVAYLDTCCAWPPQVTITSPLMRRVTVHVPLEAMSFPWVIRPREGHGCREAFIVLASTDPKDKYISRAQYTPTQWVCHLVRHFFNGSGAQWGALGPDGNPAPLPTVVTIVGLERKCSDVPRALREIASLIGPDGEARLENHLIAMSYSEWLAREGEDAELEKRAEFEPVKLKPKSPARKRKGCHPDYADMACASGTRR